MMKQKGLHDFQGINFKNFILLFPEIGSWCVCGLGKNSALIGIRVKFEVLKLLHLCLDCHEICFDKAKGFY